MRDTAAPERNDGIEPIPTSSTVHLDDWVSPDIADDNGLLRAGKLFEWMDVVGVLVATRYSRCNVVTASVDAVFAKDPIPVGSRLSMTGQLACTSPHSMGVSLTLMHHAAESKVSKSLRGFMTFVPLDADGRALAVTPYEPNTPAERALAREGRLRRNLRKQLHREGGLSLLGPSIVSNDRSTRRLFIGEALKILPGRLRLPWDRPPRQRRHLSYVHRVEPVRAGHLNFNSTLYGGTLMGWVESTANLSARAYLESTALRFVGLHGLSFLSPVRSGTFVHIKAMVVHTTEADLSVLVDVRCEDALAGTFTDTLRGFLTYAPVGRREISPLTCHDEEEARLFDEVAAHLRLQSSLAAEE